MRAQVSPGTGRRYPLTLICQVFRVSRSSVYAAQAPPAPAGPPGKRGPKTRWVDAELVAGIRVRSAVKGCTVSVPHGLELGRVGLAGATKGSLALGPGAGGRTPH